MKKVFYSIVFLSILAILLSGTLGVSNAQDAVPTFRQDNILRFTDLAVADTQLFAPFDVMQVQFGLPSEYALAAGSALTLDFNTFLSIEKLT